MKFLTARCMHTCWQIGPHVCRLAPKLRSWLMDPPGGIAGADAFPWELFGVIGEFRSSGL